MQRVSPHRLDRTIGSVCQVVLAASGGQPQIYPVGRAVGGAGKLLGVNKGLQEVNGMLVEDLPVCRNPSGHPCQQVAGQMRNAYPRKDEKAGVVGEEVNVVLPRLRTPPDVSVPRTQVARGGAETKTDNRAFLAEDHVLQLLAHRVAVAQVVILLDETAPQPLPAASPYLSNLQRSQFLEGAGDGGALHLDGRWFFPLCGKRIGGVLFFRRKLQQALALQLKHHPSTDHVAGLTVGLSPVPRLAEFHRQSSATAIGIRVNQISDELDVLGSNLPTPVTKDPSHAQQSSAKGSWNARPFFQGPLRGTCSGACKFFHEGATRASFGCPFHNSSCSSWAANVSTALAVFCGHQEKCPLDNLF